MAWEARLGLKRAWTDSFYTHILRLNGLGSPFGIETIEEVSASDQQDHRLNGLGSPFGIETVARSFAQVLPRYG